MLFVYKYITSFYTYITPVIDSYVSAVFVILCWIPWCL